MVTCYINEFFPPGYLFIMCLSKRLENLSEVKSLPSPHSRVPQSLWTCQVWLPADQPLTWPHLLPFRLTLPASLSHTEQIPHPGPVGLLFIGQSENSQSRPSNITLNFQQILPVFLFINFRFIFILCDECFTCMYKCAVFMVLVPMEVRRTCQILLELEFRMLVSTPQDARN